jgi:channel protein (hemolysin III family)
MGVVSPVLGFCEPVASWLHAGGAIVAVLSTRSLCRSAATPGASLALGLFGAAVVMSLAVSGIYHAIDIETGARAVFQRLDHAFIWILIAATFTPVHVILFRGPWRWAMLAFIWTCAIAGVALKTIFFADVGPGLGLALYLILGWLGVVSAAKIWQQDGRGATHLLLAGGLLYSLGGAASVAEMPVLIPGYVGHHELFHVAVLAALYAHWRFMHSAIALRRPADYLSFGRGGVG